MEYGVSIFHDICHAQSVKNPGDTAGIFPGFSIKRIEEILDVKRILTFHILNFFKKFPVHNPCIIGM